MPHGQRRRVQHGAARQSWVGGGFENKVSASYASISGGKENKATAEFSSILGGLGNVTETGKYGTVSGGHSEQSQWRNLSRRSAAANTTPPAAKSRPSAAAKPTKPEGFVASVSGGNNKSTANGEVASVSGGGHNERGLADEGAAVSGG